MRGPGGALFIGLLAGHFLGGDAPGGKLDKFERDATKDRSERRHDDPRPDYDHWDSPSYFGSHHSSSSNVLSGVFDALLIQPGLRSMARTTNDTSRLADWNLDPRRPGDPFIPLIRVDAAYKDIESDIEALDYRLQLGYGPLAFELNGTRFEEESPSDRLDLYRLYGLYRMSYGEVVEIDLGFGGMILDGEDRDSGMSFTIPFLVRATDWLLVEFRPMWSDINGTRIDEYEAGVLLNWKFTSLKAGYRWLESPHESLNGPFLGLSFRY